MDAFRQSWLARLAGIPQPAVQPLSPLPAWAYASNVTARPAPMPAGEMSPPQYGAMPRLPDASQMPPEVGPMPAAPMRVEALDDPSMPMPAAPAPAAARPMPRRAAAPAAGGSLTADDLNALSLSLALGQAYTPRAGLDPAAVEQAKQRMLSVR